MEAEDGHDYSCCPSYAPLDLLLESFADAFLQVPTKGLGVHEHLVLQPLYKVHRALSNEECLDSVGV